MNKNTEFLAIKEQRFNRVKSLVNETQCVILIKVNYPGNQKLNAFTFFVFHEAIRTLDMTLDDITYSIEGPVGVKVSNENPMVLKERFVSFEDTHPLGRLIDCDVLTVNGMMSRSDLKDSLRPCFICDQAAHVCIVSKKHTMKAVKQAFHQRVLAYCKSSLSTQILFAMLAEVSTHPSFGLVNPINSGIHQDMDCSTFIHTAYAIAPHFNDVNKIPTTISSQEYFNKLRQLGIEIENTMLQATQGVNTHKGLIFLLLMTLGAKYYYKDLQLKDAVQQLAVHVLADFKAKPTSTGLEWYHKANIQGVREVVLTGLSQCLDGYVPNFLKNMEMYDDCNDAFVTTQLLVMSETQDTTILKRGGIEKLQILQEKAKQAMHHPSQWQKFSDWCVSNQLSPGGSADLLALLVMLAYFFYDKNEEPL